MLTRIWTSFLLSLVGVATIAWLVALMHEKDIRPVQDLVTFFKKQSKVGRVLLGTFFIAMWVIASTKPGNGGGNGGGEGGGGDGGTNNIQMVIGPVGGLQPLVSLGVVTNSQQQGLQGGILPPQGGLGLLGDPAPVTDQWTDFAPITSANTTRTLDGDDFRRGFVMTRIGTGEAFDFAAPSNATVCADWEAFGAAEDWMYIAISNWVYHVGTNEVSRLRVYSFGKITPLIRDADGVIATNNWFAPFMASLGIVPEANWNLLDESARPSQLWYCITPQNALVVTWRNALLDRDTEKPISFQVEFRTDGRFSFRYWNVIDGKFVQDQTVQRITSLRPPMRLDISRDGSIDDGDSAAWFDGQTFYYWINECKIYGDYIVPDREYIVRNTSDLLVNGTFDLVNLFPVALDLSKFTDAWQNRVTYTLHPEWGNTNSFNFCFADIPWSEAGKIQTTNVTTLAGQPLSSASLTSLPKAGYQLHYYDTLTQFSENSGLLICEAKSRYASMRLDIKVGDMLLYSYSVPMTILPVKEMYSWINGRNLSGASVIRSTAVHRIWDEQNAKSLIFLHGANVSEAQAEDWGDILFKRMWVSGIHADFYNVDWRSNIGGPANYQENASNAFVVASQLAPILSNIPGEKIIMAHSLGNMVVSSMIQDHGLQVSKYIMCNSAVPAEAYDTTLTPTNVLVHKDWNEYPRKSFANEWYKCFENDIGDDRQLLTWGGRFADVADYAVNFYSTGDHVLELERSNNIWDTDGYENWSQKFERYSWHKQELWKGRKGLFFNMGTTDWAGWGIRENVLGYNTIQPTNAWLMSLAELKTNTVFKLQPESMNTNSIPLLLRGAHLAMGIPARTPASGAMKWGPPNMSTRMWDLNSTNVTQNGLSRPNGWIVRPNGLFDDWGTRWLHSDMKDMAYFYVFKFFEKLKEKGELE